MHHADRCPICEDSDLATHLESAEGALTSADIGSSRGEVSVGRVLRCRRCGFGFRRSRPSDDELAGLYREMDVGVYEAEAAGRRRTAEVEVGIVRRHAAPGRILDVGCASGAFLQAARLAGFAVTGVEPSETLAREARAALGAEAVIPAPLQASGLAASSFDVVTLWDVLEHVPEPRSFLESCASLLVPGGWLVANVPDLDSLPARLLGARWPLLLPEHLNYFNEPSLRACGDRAGLRWVRSGRRFARFSADYILYRLGQHAIPGVGALRRVLRASPFAGLIFPVPLGELYGVWQRR